MYTVEGDGGWVGGHRLVVGGCVVMHMHVWLAGELVWEISESSALYTVEGEFEAWGPEGSALCWTCWACGVGGAEVSRRARRCTL